MSSPRSILARVSGPTAAIGGLLWVVNVVLHAVKPEGCIAAECDLPGRTGRVGGPLFDALILGALLLMGLGAMLATNEQNNRVLLALPFGIAWIAAGHALWSTQGDQPKPM